MNKTRIATVLGKRHLMRHHAIVMPSLGESVRIQP